MQHFKFVNWWIRGFVYLMSRTGYWLRFSCSQFSFYFFFAYTQDTKTTADDMSYVSILSGQRKYVVVLQGQIADGQEPAPAG